MQQLRVMCLACLLFLSGGLQSFVAPDVVNGPFHGSFIHAGLGLKKPLSAETSPVQAKQQWTIYCWTRSDGPIEAGTLLAGFGEPVGAAGTARYLSVRDGFVSFWSGNASVQTETRLAANRWQFLAATFADGRLTLYSDGAQIASHKMELSPAAPVLYLAPVAAPWPNAAHFAGKIAALTLVSRALTPAEISALLDGVNNSLNGAKTLDILPFEAASKTWPIQTKGQDGLRAPQDASTLPASRVGPAWANSARPASSRVASRDVSKLSQRETGEWAIEGGWRLTQASSVKVEGDAISRAGFAAREWMAATVPGTVLTTLVERGVYPDPEYGLNNLSIPESLNKQAYWYRTEFNVPANAMGQRFALRLHGINYSAQVWLNGKALGEVRGAFTRGEFDVSKQLIPGRVNALAIRVSPPPHPGIPHEQSVKAGPGPNGGQMCIDGPTFICTEGWDWIPGIRDRNTGIWQEVTLKITGPVKIGDVQVVSQLPLPATSRADLFINVPLRNDSARPVAGVLEASFEGVRILRRTTLQPGNSTLNLSPVDFPQLSIARPRLWWPNGYGRPDLYHLRVSFRATGGVESDRANVRFGIREVSYELTLLDQEGRLRRVEFRPTIASGLGQHVINLSHEGIIQSAEGWVPSFMPGGEDSRAISNLADLRTQPFLVIRVNGVRIACKGGNWGLDDSRKRVSRERLEPFFRLHRDAHLTMIRNWCGQNTEEVFYDLADEYGLLVWNDFWLSTQDWNLEPSDPALFLANARETILRFRNHPSIAIWCGRNEGVPPPLINEGLDQLIRTLDGARYYIPNSRSINLQDSGPWNYGEAESFYTRRARGFSTEIGLPSPPSADAMRAMMPSADVWPPSDTWAYHDWHAKGGQEVTAFLKALEDELGPAESLEDFERKAQLINYVSHRAMFEGFNSHLWNPNTGRLMWMTHPSWPSMVWQMYGSDYETYGAFYGIKKACEPLHVQLNLPALATAVVNNTREPAQGLRLGARVLSMSGLELFSREERLNAPPGMSVESFPLEIAEAASKAPVFIKLSLKDAAGRELSENFYWYAAQKEKYRQLTEMATARVDGAARLETEGEQARVIVDLTNANAGIALATQVTLRRAATHARVLPAYASDNFISLLPGEARRIILEVPLAAARDGGLEISVKGWNVRETSVPVQRVR